MSETGNKDLINLIAKHVEQFHYGPSFTGVNLKELLDGVDWESATKQVHNLNTIAMLVFHINYYISAVLKVLKGGPLDAHDKFSYDLPPIKSEKDWENLKSKVFYDADQFVESVLKLEDSVLYSNFLDGKYGIYFRNLFGLMEHSHYHLGQISLIKKIISSLK